MTLPPACLAVCVQDWTRPGPYEQTLLVNTVRRSRDPSGHQQGGDTTHSQGEESRLLRGSHSMTSHKVKGCLETPFFFFTLANDLTAKRLHFFMEPFSFIPGSLGHTHICLSVYLSVCRMFLSCRVNKPN